MADSRESILKRIRAASPPPTPQAEITFEPIRYDDLVAQFSETLSLVGGQCMQLQDASELQDALEQLETWQSATRRCVLVPEVTGGTVDLQHIADPHDLEDVDYALLEGSPAVAENAAVWVTDDNLPHRVVPFLTQHLGLVVPARSLVHTMHEAYQVIRQHDQEETAGSPSASLLGRFGRTGFGVFISGPSKTADIEQSLVTGAHGARSLTVFLIGPAPAAG